MANLFYRTALLEQDATTKALSVAFASEFPVLRKEKREQFWEVLSHAPGDANLGHLNRAGIVLQDHDENKEIGDVVRRSAHVDADKKTRAQITIEEPRWQTRAKDAPTSIPISVGYVRKEKLSEEMGADGIPIRRFAWAPYEISLLTGEAADPTAGINRSKRGVKRRCADCEGTGRCRCRAAAEDDADENCESCGGNGKCADCGGDGYFESARSAIVDSQTKADAQAIATQVAEQLKNQMRILHVPDATAGAPPAPTAADERKRGVAIDTIADTLIKNHGSWDNGKMRDKISGMARDAKNSDETVEHFQLRVMEDVLKAKPAEQISLEDCTDERGAKQYSFMRGIQSLIRRAEVTGEKLGRGAIPDGLEGEVHQEFMRRSKAEGGGFNPWGWQVPSRRGVNFDSMSIRERRRYMRDLQVNVFGAGGAAVATQMMVPVIELLRNKLVLAWAGTRTLGGLTSNVVIPRQTAPATAYSVAEIAALTTSQLVLDQIALSPKRVGVQTVYSKQLLMQSTPDIEALIYDDAFKVIAIDIDRLGINGQGAASEPLGVMNTPGIGTMTWAGAPTYKNVLIFETTIRNNNVIDPLVYISTPNSKGDMKQVVEALSGATVAAAGNFNALWKGLGEGDGEVNGYPARDSLQIPNNQMLVGAFNHLIHAMWGGLDVVLEPYTKAGNAEWVLTINTWNDFAVRHPQAFMVSTDGANQ